MINERISLADIIDQNIVSSIDAAAATPVNSGEFLYSIEKQIPSPGPDASHPYPSINDSPNATAIKGSVFALAILSIIGSFIIQFYKRLRKKEALSPYFFFEKLPGIKKYLKEKQLAQGDECSFEVLSAAAYYYNPDLPTVVLGWRRAWAALTRSGRYLDLKQYLRSQLVAGKKKKEILASIYQKISEDLASYISEKGIYGSWTAEEQAGKWVIRRKEPLEVLPKLNEEAKEKESKTIAQQVWHFIEARLDEVVKSAYLYWISSFIFYFFAGVGVVGGVVWPPILIATVFLLTLWGGKCVIKAIQYRKQEESPANENPDDASVCLQIIRYHMQIQALLELKSELKTSFAASKLSQEGKRIIQKRSNMIFVGAILNGLVGGLIKMVLISWLLFSAIGLVVTISPIGSAIVAGATFLLGISWGIYLAWKYFKSSDALLENRAKCLSGLEEHSSDIPNCSLREYDRLFRRGQTNKTFWAATKQAFKRAWEGFSGVGTGIFVLKASGYGVGIAILAAFGISASIGFLPAVCIFLGGGLIYASWCIYQYHLESQETQLDHVINSLSHPLFTSEQAEIAVSRIQGEESKTHNVSISPQNQQSKKESSSQPLEIPSRTSKSVSLMFNFSEGFFTPAKNATNISKELLCEIASLTMSN